VETFNLRAAQERLNQIGGILNASNPDLAGLGVIEAIKKLADIVGIPKSLEELGVKQEDFAVLAQNALRDVCGLTNPIQASHAEIVGIFASAYGKRS
jgi:alcohol dehydrogenase